MEEEKETISKPKEDSKIKFKIKLKDKLKVKNLVRSSKYTISIPESKPAEYKPIYFKQKFDEDKKQFFFN